MAHVIKMPMRTLAGVAGRSVAHILIAIAASVVISHLILLAHGHTLAGTGLAAAVLAPLAIGGPMIIYAAFRHAQLATAYERLEASAARDSLTRCLNHGAFVARVMQLMDDPASRGGALLVIDADHFKSINDQFGHPSGDAALKLIASAIGSATDPEDIVGRLGGEEFGVFLPGASLPRGKEVAENIRLAINTIEFRAREKSCTLSVSIGGAVCTGPVAFGEMFRKADERLYKVKASGRNGCDLDILASRTARLEDDPVAPQLIYRGQKAGRA